VSALVVAAVCRKITRRLARLDGEDEAAEQEPLFAIVANASVTDRAATGARFGAKVLRVGSRREPVEATVVGKRCPTVDGFNLHANVRIGANDHDASWSDGPPD
jgi:hypothetical protein